MKRVGLFSGTFDPVHRGHIAFALAAAKQCRLDKVFLLPERSPRGKIGVSSFEHRLNMAKLVVRRLGKLGTLTLPDEQFTVDTTLPTLQQQFPDTQLVLLCGSDAVRTFSYRWPNLERLLSQVELAVSLRAGESRPDLELLLDGLPVQPTVQFVEGPHSNLSSSEARAGNLLGIEPVVRNYIEAHQLYQGA